MKIKAIVPDPPRNGSSTYQEIRDYMLRPVYMDGEKKGQRLAKYNYILHDKEGVVVGMYDENDGAPTLRPSFFAQNDVTHWETTNLFLSITVDFKPVWTIPANIAAFILEVYK